MRLAFFAWEYPPRLVGGLGTYAQYITRELVKMGHDVTVFTMNTGSLKTHEVLQASQYTGRSGWTPRASSASSPRASCNRGATS